MTAQADEIAGLDGGAYGGAFARTGTEFRVVDGPVDGAVPVCRFFTVAFAPKSSHFYTADPVECDGVKANPAWQYEKIAYYIRVHGQRLPDRHDPRLSHVQQRPDRRAESPVHDRSGRLRRVHDQPRLGAGGHPVLRAGMIAAAPGGSRAPVE